MTRESDKKTRLQIKKDTYETQHGIAIAKAEASRAADEVAEKRGIVFTPTASMPSFEKFQPKVVTPVGPNRYKYLRAQFPDNFRGNKMQDRTGIENKMAGGGDENKGGPSAPVVDDTPKVNTDDAEPTDATDADDTDDKDDDTDSSADDVTNFTEETDNAVARKSAGESTNSG